MMEAELSEYITFEPFILREDWGITRLQGSLLYGSVEQIQQILCEDYGIELTSQNNDWAHKCQEIVDICIDREIDVNLTNKYSALLHFAANNFYEDFKSVLKRCKDFNINVINYGTHIHNCKTLLHFAIEKGRTSVVKSLLEIDVDVNVRETSTKKTPLFYAVSTSQIEIVKMLLKAGADVNAEDDSGGKPINYAFGLTQHKFFNYGQKLPNWELIELLCKYKADLNFANWSGTKSLCDACANGRFEEVEFLIKYGADLLTSDYYSTARNKPLCYAAEGNNSKIVEYLLQNGAHINAKNVLKENVIHRLAKRGPELIEPEDFEEIHFVPDFPLGKLEFKVIHLKKVADMIEFLVDCGADVNGFNQLHQTALNRSVSFNSLEIVECLLELKADTEPKNNHFPLLYYHHHIVQNLNFYFDRPDTCVLLTAFLATKDEDNISRYLDETSSAFEWVNPLFQQCKAQVNEMKKKTICDNRSVTFFDFLTKDLKEVLLFCRNEEIMTVLECGEHKQEFRLYKYLFEKRLERVQRLKKCNDAFMRFLTKYFKKSLPSVVVNEIISYLTAGDLRNFGRALCISKEFPDGNYYYRT